MYLYACINASLNSRSNPNAKLCSSMRDKTKNNSQKQRNQNQVGKIMYENKKKSLWHTKIPTLTIALQKRIHWHSIKVMLRVCYFPQHSTSFWLANIFLPHWCKKKTIPLYWALSNGLMLVDCAVLTLVKSTNSCVLCCNVLTCSWCILHKVGHHNLTGVIDHRFPVWYSAHSWLSITKLFTKLSILRCDTATTVWVMKPNV